MALYSARLEYMDKCVPSPCGQAPKEYGWLRPVAGLIMERTQTLTLCVGQEDERGLSSIARFAARADQDIEVAGGVEMCTGSLDDALAYELLDAPLDQNGLFKWRCLLFRREGTVYATIDKYGKEAFIQGLESADLEYLSQALAGYEFSFISWEEAVGTEVTLSQLAGDFQFYGANRLGDELPVLSDFDKLMV